MEDEEKKEEKNGGRKPEINPVQRKKNGGKLRCGICRDKFRIILAQAQLGQGPSIMSLIFPIF